MLQKQETAYWWIMNKENKALVYKKKTRIHVELVFKCHFPNSK